MVPPWIVSCSCGWVGAAQTPEEACTLIDVHRIQAVTGARHFITLKGEVNRDRPEPHQEH